MFDGNEACGGTFGSAFNSINFFGNVTTNSSALRVRKHSMLPILCIIQLMTLAITFSQTDMYNSGSSKPKTVV